MLLKRFHLLVVLPRSDLSRITCRCWSKPLQVALSMDFGHLTLAFLISLPSTLTCVVFAAEWLWVVHVLSMDRLKARLLHLPLTICKIGISSIVVFNRALISLCLTCKCSASLPLVSPSALSLQLLYSESPYKSSLWTTFGLHSLRILCSIAIFMRLSVVCPFRSIFHSASQQIIRVAPVWGSMERVTSTSTHVAVFPAISQSFPPILQWFLDANCPIYNSHWGSRSSKEMHR